MHKAEVIETFLEDTLVEIQTQEDKWGVQVHPTGCGTAEYQRLEEIHRNITNQNADRGLVTWADILLEEVYEALGATTPYDVATELVQISAVCASMVRSINENGL